MRSNLCSLWILALLIVGGVLHSSAFTADPSVEDLPGLVRDAKDGFRGTAADLEEAKQEYAEQLEALAVVLEQRADQAEPSQLDHMGRLLGWLEQHDQAPSVVAAVRRQYSHPNLKIHVAQSVLTANLRRSVEMTTPVQQEILRAKVTGTATTIGTVRGLLVPDESHAVFELWLDATTRSKTVAVRGPVRISSRGSTELDGRKRISFGPEGFIISPTTSSATTQTTTTGISTRLRGFMDRMVKKLATRQVDKKREQGNRIASQYAQQMINRMMDEEVDETLEQAQMIYRDKIRAPLLSKGDFPRQFEISSSSDALRVSLLQANANQMAAPGPAPELTGKPDLGLVLHESAVNNFAAAVLGGKTLTEEQIRGQLAQLRRDEPTAEAPTIVDPTGPGSIQITVPSELIEIPMPEETTQGIEITLAQENPVTLRIDDGIVAITFRADRLVDGEKTYPPMNVTVRVVLEKVEGGVRSALQGEPEILPPRLADGKAGELTPEETEIQGKIKDFLDREVRREFVSEGIELPAQMESLGILRVTQLTVDDGWLALACDQELTAEAEAMIAQESEPTPVVTPSTGGTGRACRARSTRRR